MATADAFDDAVVRVNELEVRTPGLSAGCHVFYWVQQALHVLTSPEAKRALEQRGIELISYCDL